MYLDNNLLKDGLNTGFKQDYYFTILKSLKIDRVEDSLPVDIGVIFRTGYSNEINVEGEELFIKFPLDSNKEELNYYDILDVISRGVKGKYTRQTLDKIIPNSHLIPCGVLKVDNERFTLLFSLVVTFKKVGEIDEFTMMEIKDLDYTKLSKSANSIKDVIIEVNTK